ncbi:carboxymuconolactone decarboxylase family protein [Streptomyces luteolus]|uniref:Carboxymuconolactone decarboxylase family protein n=1 Tax=Streptomyces luteolus TaxID=3043615 RepID=A0ABT6T122_9ACTN|nr:carboxymuconolactone decarboxylase family protein [Streptomyces sp. B-S-A12]MDI3421150.1 carboxymuconolactone decarboxylase family protein [Streptomyces sp. B-S-A12]
MEPRFHLMESPTAAKVAKRFFNASLPLEQSTVPKALRELVELRVGQLNGCAFCVDVHSKEAAAAGESAPRLSLVAVWRHRVVRAGHVRRPGRLSRAGPQVRIAPSATKAQISTNRMARSGQTNRRYLS